MNCKLSVITPIYNSTATLGIFLESVFASQFRDFELIIVDDLSPDDPKQILRGYNVNYLRLPQRGGSANARNQAVKIARGEILLFLDPDITIQRNTLGSIVQAFEDHPEVAGLIGSYDEDPGAKNLVSQFKYLFHHYVHYEAAFYVGSFWTGCGAVRKNVFNEVGTFDTTFFKGLNTINDIEFGYRLKQRGLKVLNAKDIQVKHWKRLDLGEWVWTDIVDRGSPWIKIMIQYHDFEPTLNVNGRDIICVLCAWVLLVSLLASLVSPGFLAAVLGTLMAIVFFKRNMIMYLYSKRGLRFCLYSIPLILMYYFNCGLSVLLGLLMQRKL